MKNMRKAILLGVIIGLLLVSVVVGAYAHGQENKEEEEHDEWDYMEEMHEECEEVHRYNGGHMMGVGMM